MAFMKVGAPEKQKPIISDVEYEEIEFDDAEETEDDDEPEETDSG